MARNKICCQSGVTFDNRDPMTMTDLKMMYNLHLLRQISVVDVLVRRSGNEDVSNWEAKLESRSIRDIRVIIQEFGLSIHIWIIE
jgi:hypothetical protein